jgi:hypothetical protein
VSILEDSVVIETTPGTRIEFVKAAVRSVIAPIMQTPAPKATVKPRATKPQVAAKGTTKKTTTTKVAK